MKKNIVTWAGLIRLGLLLLVVSSGELMQATATISAQIDSLLRPAQDALAQGLEASSKAAQNTAKVQQALLDQRVAERQTQAATVAALWQELKDLQAKVLAKQRSQAEEQAQAITQREAALRAELNRRQEATRKDRSAMQAEVDAIEQKITFTEQAIAKGEATLALLTSKLAALQKLQQQQAETVAALQQIHLAPVELDEASEKRQSALAKQMADLQGAIKFLALQKENALQALHEQQALVEATANQANQLTVQLKQRQAALAKATLATKSIQALQIEIKRLKTKLVARQKEQAKEQASKAAARQSLQQEIERLQKQLGDQFGGLLGQLQRQALQNQLTMTQRRSDELLQQSSLLKQQQQSINNALAAVRNEILQATLLLANNSSGTANIKAILATLSQRVDAARAQQTGLRERLQNTAAQRPDPRVAAGVEVQLAQAKESLAARARVKADLVAQLQQLRLKQQALHDSQEQLKRMQAQSSILNQKLVEFNNRKAELAALQGKLSAAQQNLQAAQAQLTDLTAQVQDVKRLEDEVQALQRQVDQVMAKDQELSGRLNSLRAQCATVQG